MQVKFSVVSFIFSLPLPAMILLGLFRYVTINFDTLTQLYLFIFFIVLFCLSIFLFIASFFRNETGLYVNILRVLSVIFILIPLAWILFLIGMSGMK